MTVTYDCARCGVDTPNAFRLCDRCVTVEAAQAPPLPDDVVALLRATGIERYLPQRRTDAAA